VSKDATSHPSIISLAIGKTVRQSLEEIPGCVDATSSFENSHASITANLDIYGGVTYAASGDTTFIFNVNDQNQLDSLRKRLADDAVKAIEDVGFDASVLKEGEDLEYHRVESEKDVTQLQVATLSPLEIQSAESYAKECDADEVEAVISLQIKGMSCAVCTGRVEKALKDIGLSVKSANVSLPTNRASVQLAKDALDTITSSYGQGSKVSDRAKHFAETCADAVTRAGYECEVLEIYNPAEGGGGGMTLTESAAKLEQSQREELKSWGNLLLLSTIFTTPLILLHYTSMMGAASSSTNDQKWKQWVSFYLATPVQFAVGKRYYVAAYHSFKNGRVMGMAFLVCLGTTAAYLYSVIVLGISSMGLTADVEQEGLHLKATFETSAMLLTFVTLGKYLEAYAKGKTASALQTLMELQPIIATSCLIPDSLKQKDEHTGIESFSKDLKMNGIQKEEVEVKSICVGEYLLVIPGSRIPTDGIIVYQEGNGDHSYVDESALSGEPFPVAKAIGDSVFGSTVNQFSTLIIKVTATGAGTVISRIVRLIEEAQVNKAPIQALADYIASIFAPTVLCISGLTLVCWLVFNRSVDTQERFFVAFMSAISVIVVACPCALGLATPTAVMVGTGVGASNGLLIKGGAVLENAHQVDTVVFDKTGTLTTGRATLGERMEFMDNAKEDDLLLQSLPTKVDKHNLCVWLAACAEMNSEHPLAQAITNGSKTIIGMDFTCAKDGVNVSKCVVVPGQGVEALVSRQGWGSWWVRVGKSTFAKAVPGCTGEDDKDLQRISR
jgi:Cu+-exporting ATPase